MNIIERAIELRGKIEENSAAMPDVEALQYAELFPGWDGGGVEYAAGTRLRHDGILYKALQNHTSQYGWEPGDSPSLFAKVLIPNPDAVPEWEQPDSTNPYMQGDIVMHNGKKWESLMDGNVWEPGMIGAEGIWREMPG